MQSYGLPNLATFEEIGQMLQRGEIQRWYVNPEQNPENAPNVFLSFISKTGGLYSVLARYDPQTNQIFPPGNVSFRAPVPTAIPSLIKWNKAHNILEFDRIDTMIPRVEQRYEGQEILGRVSRNYFDPIFQAIDSFQSERYIYKLRQVHTDVGAEQCALSKQWSNNNARLQLWITSDFGNADDDEEDNKHITEDGWTIVYGDANTFLIVGQSNGGNEPYVITPTFKFYYPRSYRYENIDYPSLNLEQVKMLLKSKVIEYIFEATSII